MNNKRHKVLPTDQLARLFDNVPIVAGAQEVIGNRLLYGDYTDGYDFVDGNGDRIEFLHNLSTVDEDTATTSNPKVVVFLPSLFVRYEHYGKVMQNMNLNSTTNTIVI